MESRSTSSSAEPDLATADTARPPEARRVWPRHRGLRVLVVVLVILLVLLVADRVTARVANAKVAAAFARSISCVTGASVTPDVRIGGFPFLTELAAGSFSTITVTAADIRLRGVALNGLAITAADVVAPRGGHPAKVGSVSVAATVPYSTLPSEVDGRSVRYGATSDGRLTISTRTSLGGIPLPVTVTASVRLSDGALSVTPEDIRVLGIRRSLDDLDSPFARWLSGGRAAELSGASATTTRELPALPNGLDYASVVPTAGGLTITMTGHDLQPPTGQACVAESG